MRVYLGGLIILTGLFMASTGEAKNCRVQVLEVLEATIYRGPPYLVQMLERDRKHAEMIQGESHGDHHLTCTYKVLINSQPYKYQDEISNTLLKLKEDYCATLKAKRKVREWILQLTDRCKNPRAQPVWGYPLEPLPS